MLFILLLLLNGFIIFCFEVLILRCFFRSVVTSIDLFSCGLLAFGIVLSCIFLFDSPLGQGLLRLLIGARPLIEREKRELAPLLEHVQQIVQASYGYPPIRKLQIMMLDVPTLQALTIGKNYLIITQGLYAVTNQEELMGVVTHELSHLHHGSSRRLAIACGVSAITLMIAWLSQKSLQVANVLYQNTRGHILLSPLVLIIQCCVYFLLTLVWLGYGMIKLALLSINRQQEYRADQFAVKAGFGEGLLAFLEKSKNLEWTTRNYFLRTLLATHPPLMLRIQAIEKLLQN